MSHVTCTCIVCAEVGVEVSAGQEAEKFVTNHRVVHANIQVNRPQTRIAIGVAECHEVDGHVSDNALFRTNFALATH
jgi:hypothetical protein